jgi:hypothetical protein
MSVTINVNGLSLCHKASGGVSRATLPDVCKTPPVPIPIPYPNIAYSLDLAKGTTTVFADGGNSIAHLPSELAVSTGDEPGTAGGVSSGTFMAEATWLTFSGDVFIEGQNACRLTDKLFHNHCNTVNASGLVQAPVGQGGARCNPIPTPAPREIICSCAYYQFRYDDFVRRMGPCGLTPPDYYLDYGKKYCETFTAELRPTLSPGGQAWLDRARCLLQEYLEDGLKKDPAVEQDSDKLRKLAFDTHPNAYWDAGLHDISVEDKLRVAMTPDLGEWTSLDTWRQALDVGARDAGGYAGDAWGWTRNTVTGAWDWTRSTATDAWNATTSAAGSAWDWVSSRWPF